MNLGWRWAALRNGLQDATAYRIEFLFEFVGSAFVPATVQWIVWYALFQLGGATTVAGMTYVDMIQYTLMSVLFTQIRGGDQDFELQEMIRTGQLSNYLLRPVGVVEFVFIRGLAPKIFIAGFCLLIGFAISLFFPFSAARMVGAMLLALMGNIIHYQIGAALSTVAFYWEEAFAMLMVKNLIVSLLSGEKIPLNLIPAAYSWIWKSTPFYLYVFAPTQFALGRTSVSQFISELLLALVWIIACWGLIRLTWGFSIKRYLSLGG
ncbi:ABC-2 family transporter protein [Bdellovibrionota bacterium FG-2]